MTTTKPLSDNQVRAIDYVRGHPGASTVAIAAAIGLTHWQTHIALASLFVKKLVGRQMALDGRLKKQSWHWFPEATS